MNLGIHAIQYPSGRWGLVGGHLPVHACYSHKDDSPLTEDETAALVQCGPGFVKDCKAITYETKEAALEAARLSK